ncbi:la-related protein 6-like [Scleropages formosus]|uniref:La ribonucleoprotein 6, translational regulator a n=1 Tax=Scleropages formosus TaxID=113540 RepID=A0A8C9TWS3_SCLFO|nr:la-related protein 6-like [Scleropages formosus]
MRSLVKAFLRCLALLLLPPLWTQLALCSSLGDECGKTPRSNRRARYKDTNLLADEEAPTRDASTPPASPPAPPCSSPPPWGSLRGRFRGLWRAAAHVFGFPSALQRRWRSSPTPPPCQIESDAQRCTETEAAEKEEVRGLVRGIMSAAMGVPEPLEPATDPPALSALEEEDEEEKSAEGQGDMSPPVTITVAIQAAEDEEPPGERSLEHLDIHSCSEDEVGKQDKSSGAGTSGGELDEEESWQPPDPELTQKLVAQIEYYLSDENLEHDAFLLKHVRRNKLGFVSVKLLTSFKKVKHLTRDWRTTAYALRHSALLELNEEGRKVRRRASVPVFASESTPSRMLLLSDLQHWPELGVALQGGAGLAQQEHLMELLLKAFGVYGSIASVRVLKPGKDLPPDLRKLSGRYVQLCTEECAIVEFEEVEAAVKAHESVGCKDEEGVGPLGIRVVLIGTKPPKKKTLKERPQEDCVRKSRSLNSRVRELQNQGEDSACSSSETESNPTSPRVNRKMNASNKLSPTGGGLGFPQNNHLSPAVSPRSSPWPSPRASPCALRKSPHPNKSPLASEGRLSPEPGRRWADYSSDSSLTPSGSPWVQRRRQVASQESSPVGSPMLSRKIQNADGLPPGVVRLPRGPDGTRGFHTLSMGERAKTAATQT